MEYIEPITKRTNKKQAHRKDLTLKPKEKQHLEARAREKKKKIRTQNSKLVVFIHRCIDFIYS